MSKDLNKVALIGRLVRDPELKYTASGTAVTSVSIACNDVGADKKEYVNFFDLTGWGITAEFMQKYLKKGSKIAIDGSLRQNRWQGQDGKSNSRVVIVISNIQFLDSKHQGQSVAAQNAQAVNETFNDPWAE